MNCQKLKFDQAILYATGGLSQIEQIAVGAHTRRCPDCAARLADARRELAALAALASAPVSNSARDEFFERATELSRAANVLDDTSPNAKGGRTRMKKLALAAVAAALLTGAVFAAVAPKIMKRAEMIGDIGRDNTNWQFHTLRKCRVTVYDRNGKEIGKLGNDMGDDSSPIDVTVQGEKLTFTTMGRRQVHSRTGALLGTIDIEPLTHQQIQQDQNADIDRMPTGFAAAAAWAKNRELAGKTPSGVTSMAACSFGFDRKKRLYWFVRGYATVQLIDARTRQVLFGASNEHITPPDAAEISPAVVASIQRQIDIPGLDSPTAQVQLGDATHTMHGFGTFPIADSRGKVVYNLKVARLGRM